MGMEMVIFNESPPFTLPYEPFGKKTRGGKEERLVWGLTAAVVVEGGATESWQARRKERSQQFF